MVLMSRMLTKKEGGGSTCGQKEWEYALSVDGREEKCSDVQSTLGVVCGCANVPAAIDVCPEGMEFDLDNCWDLLIDEEMDWKFWFETGCCKCQICPGGSPAGDTCVADVAHFIKEYEDVLTTEEQYIDACSKSQYKAIRECGCAWIRPSRNASCTLCEDGSPVPNPNMHFLDFAEIDHFGTEYIVLCSKAEWDIATHQGAAAHLGWGKDEMCVMQQSTLGAACGCSNPPVPACEVTCPPGTEFEMNAMVTRVVAGGSSTAPCWRQLGELSDPYSRHDRCTEKNKAELAKVCCAAPGQELGCDFKCPDGTQFFPGTTLSGGIRDPRVEYRLFMACDIYLNEMRYGTDERFLCSEDNKDLLAEKCCGFPSDVNALVSLCPFSCPEGMGFRQDMRRDPNGPFKDKSCASQWAEMTFDDGFQCTEENKALLAKSCCGVGKDPFRLMPLDFHSWIDTFPTGVSPLGFCPKGTEFDFDKCWDIFGMEKMDMPSWVERGCCKCSVCPGGSPEDEACATELTPSIVENVREYLMACHSARESAKTMCGCGNNDIPTADTNVEALVAAATDATSVTPPVDALAHTPHEGWT